jgi:tryptophan-rich sensory protein
VFRLKKSRYIVYPAIAVGVGALSGFLTRRAMKELFPLLDKPPLTPPPLVFPIVWTALYILMGVGMAMVKNTDSLASARSERLWWAQLAVNFIWTLVFFPAQAFLAALALLVLLFGLVAAMSAAFAKLNKPAAWLQLPYLLWLLVAGYLNAGIWLLNR